MTVEEKLQHFYDVSIESAKEVSASEMDEYRNALEQIFDAHKKEVQRQNALAVTTEADEIRRRNNLEISKEQLKLRRAYSAREEELTQELFEEVASRLREYKKDAAYREWMRGLVSRAAAFARGEATRIYIDPSDEALLPELKAAAPGENVEILISRESFTGGMRAVMYSRNILIDNSFLTRTAEVRENFQLRTEL